jgi:hypothetical protein
MQGFMEDCLGSWDGREVAINIAEALALARPDWF